jgi:hypothetical protein
VPAAGTVLAQEQAPRVVSGFLTVRCPAACPIPASAGSFALFNINKQRISPIDVEQGTGLAYVVGRACALVLGEFLFSYGGSSEVYSIW